MTTGHSQPDPRKGRIASTMGKARILMEAMPYIRDFKGKIVVIKYGGSAMTDEDLRTTFAGDVALLNLVGIHPVIVHGGGPHITRAMERAGIEPAWVDGLRVTDEATLRVVQSVLAGEINPDIVRLLSGHGANAAGLTGIDGGLFTAEPVDERLGLVGTPTAVDPTLIRSMLDRSFVPVVAPLGRGVDGRVYNINADTAAGALAVALGATKLVYLTDVEGLYGDLGNQETLMSRVSIEQLEAMLESGSASAGMVPKLRSCVAALQSGVARTHILDGRVQHSLLLEIFTPEGIGTMITP